MIGTARPRWSCTDSPPTDYDKQNNVEKSSIQLLGYDKIDVAAGASETVTVDVPGYFLASYDANGAKGYILDAGDYYFAVGNGAQRGPEQCAGRQVR